jgi:two-component system OmpR family response regulator|nr:winged helix-turn-helix domain-containing protein [Paraburkholderia phenazinium]
MGEKHRILVLDDEGEVRAVLKALLEEAGFGVTATATSRDMFAELSASPHSLVILDLKLEGEDGLTVARDLRRRSGIPLIMMSGRGDETDRVLGLELAADDFLNKPFSGRELLARIRAQLRRATELSYPRSPGDECASERYRFDDWVLDMSKRTLQRADGFECCLTQGEFALLSAMVLQPQRVWSRDQLLEHTRGLDSDVYDRTIDVLILRLRRKIEPNPRQPAYIRTQRGIGYVFAGSVTRL